MDTIRGVLNDQRRGIGRIIDIQPKCEIIGCGIKHGGFKEHIDQNAVLGRRSIRLFVRQTLAAHLVRHICIRSTVRLHVGIVGIQPNQCQIAARPLLLGQATRDLLGRLKSFDLQRPALVQRIHAIDRRDRDHLLTVFVNGILAFLRRAAIEGFGVAFTLNIKIQVDGVTRLSVCDHDVAVFHSKRGGFAVDVSANTVGINTVVRADMNGAVLLGRDLHFSKQRQTAFNLGNLVFPVKQQIDPKLVVFHVRDMIGKIRNCLYSTLRNINGVDW